VAFGFPQNYSNTPVGYAPATSGVASYDHTFNLPNATLDGQISGTFATRRLLANDAITNSSNDVWGRAYGLMDVSLRYARLGSPWGFTGYVRNVTNALVPQNGGGYTRAVTNGTTYSFETNSYLPPRTAGVIVERKF
jgi:hypothetical protein